jgi:hypothetical protein
MAGESAKLRRPITAQCHPNCHKRSVAGVQTPDRCRFIGPIRQQEERWVAGFLRLPGVLFFPSYYGMFPR